MTSIINVFRLTNYQQGKNSSIPKSSSYQSAYTKKSSSFPNVQVPPMHTGHRHSIGSVTLQSHLTNFPVTQPWHHER